MSPENKQKWGDRLWGLVAAVLTTVIMGLIMRGLMINGFREELAKEMAEMRGNISANYDSYARLNTDLREHIREDDARDHRQDEELARHEERIQWIYGN